MFDYEGKDTERKQLKAKGNCNFYSHISLLFILVSIMRHNINVEIKYQSSNKDDDLDESKEEETPLSQIAKII